MKLTGHLPAVQVAPLTGVVLLAVVFAAVLFGPPILGVDPNSQNLTATLEEPSASHLLGTDQYGRDVFARVLYGGRVSLVAAIAIVLVSVAIGTVVGLLATTPGPVGGLLTGLLDTLVALPALVMALAVVGALGIGMHNLVIAFIVVSWPFYGRLVRGFALDRLARADIIASRTLGVGQVRILATHVAPATLRTIGIAAGLDLGYTVAALAGFSYLGLGAQAPDPEWGLLLRDAQLFFMVAPWLLIGPSMAIGITVLGTALLTEHAHERGLAR